TANDLAAECANHAHRRNLARHLIVVQVSGSADIHASVGHIERALSIMRESRHASLIDSDDLIRLFADFSHAAREIYVLILTVHAAKGVARERARRGFAPSHDNASIKAASQRD